MHNHSHSHHQSLAEGGSPSLDRNLAISIGLNALIVVFEAAGGVVSGSLGLLSDARHNLSDVAALAMALGARKLGRRPNSVRHTYGLGRLEVLTAFLNSATLLIVSTLICREAIVRLLHPAPIRGGIMLTVAVVGLTANLASVFLLKGHHHGDLNMRSAFLHLAQDAVASALVVVAAFFLRLEIRRVPGPGGFDSGVAADSAQRLGVAAGQRADSAGGHAARAGVGRAPARRAGPFSRVRFAPRPRLGSERGAACAFGARAPGRDAAGGGRRAAGREYENTWRTHGPSNTPLWNRKSTAAARTS